MLKQTETFDLIDNNGHEPGIEADIQNFCNASLSLNAELYIDNSRIYLKKKTRMLIGISQYQKRSDIRMAFLIRDDKIYMHPDNENGFYITNGGKSFYICSLFMARILLKMANQPLTATYTVLKTNDNMYLLTPKTTGDEAKTNPSRKRSAAAANCKSNIGGNGSGGNVINEIKTPTLT